MLAELQLVTTMAPGQIDHNDMIEPGTSTSEFWHGQQVDQVVGGIKVSFNFDVS